MTISPDLTTRQNIAETLRGGFFTAKEISRAVGVREKEVLDHLPMWRGPWRGPGALGSSSSNRTACPAASSSVAPLWIEICVPSGLKAMLKCFIYYSAHLAPGIHYAVPDTNQRITNNQLILCRTFQRACLFLLPTFRLRLGFPIYLSVKSTIKSSFQNIFNFL